MDYVLTDIEAVRTDDVFFTCVRLKAVMQSAGCIAKRDDSIANGHGVCASCPVGLTISRAVRGLDRLRPAPLSRRTFEPWPTDDDEVPAAPVVESELPVSDPDMEPSMEMQLNGHANGHHSIPPASPHVSPVPVVTAAPQAVARVAEIATPMPRLDLVSVVAATLRALPDADLVTAARSWVAAFVSSTLHLSLGTESPATAPQTPPAPPPVVAAEPDPEPPAAPADDRQEERAPPPRARRRTSASKRARPARVRGADGTPEQQHAIVDIVKSSKRSMSGDEIVRLAKMPRSRVSRILVAAYKSGRIFVSGNPGRYTQYAATQVMADVGVTRAKREVRERLGVATS